VLPAPGQQILKARVIGPSPALAQLPLATAKNGLVNDLQKPGIKLLQALIRRLIGTSAQEDGKFYLAPLKLPFMKKSHSGKRG
jgi:hypothetical protein